MAAWPSFPVISNVLLNTLVEVISGPSARVLTLWGLISFFGKIYWRLAGRTN